MTKLSAIALLMFTFTGCAAIASWTATPRLDDWLTFVNHVNGLDTAELIDEYSVARNRLRGQRRDVDRLRLSYLLSRPNLPMQDISKSQILLAEIGSDSSYAPYRDLVARELVLLIDLQAAQRSAQELQTQLETLKGIDTDLTQGQAEIEELSK
jgi:hypothetical protein